MAGSVNKVILVGNLGADPEVKSFQNGGKHLQFAHRDHPKTGKTAPTGEKKERTEWHSVVLTVRRAGRRCRTLPAQRSKSLYRRPLRTRKWQDHIGQ